MDFITLMSPWPRIYFRKPAPSEPNKVLGYYDATGFHPTVEAPTTADDTADEIQE